MTDFSSIKRPHKSYLPYVMKVCTFFATYLKLLLEKTSNAGLVYSRTSCNIRCKHRIIHVVESELRFFACVPSGTLFICVCSEKSKIITNTTWQLARVMHPGRLPLLLCSLIFLLRIRMSKWSSARAFHHSMLIFFVLNGENPGLKTPLFVIIR